ncbi:MAG: DNA polymerase III subunit delta [Bacteroidales bacterium]|nr:DNA polymerase III subunit delta [Bacteroidales bacterium]
MASPAITFDSLVRSLRNGQYTPVYAIHGEEGYYIDSLVRQFESIVPVEDRDFALTVIYAPRVEPQSVVDICRQLPMMTERQVVIVKEAQSVPATWLDKLKSYVSSPTPSTLLAICGRGDKLKSKEFVKAVQAAGGTVYEAQKVKEWQVPRLLTEYIKTRGLTADPKAIDMLCEFVGADLSRLYNEVDKLAQILGPNARVTPESVERNIGVSKDYNNFELVDAVAAKDPVRIFRIIRYFESNPKGNTPVVTVATLFAFFADLLSAYYAKDRSDAGLRQELNIRNDFALRRLRAGMASYNAFQIIEIIDLLRQFDTMSKGGGSRQDPFRLLHDLMFRIITARGKMPV